MFEDTGALKANLKVRAFDTYVTRYASAWNKREPVADKEPQTSSVTPAPVANAAEPSVAHPLDPKYDFPSSASIPAVSIMNAEPAAAERTDRHSHRPPGGRKAGRKCSRAAKTSTGAGGDAAGTLISGRLKLGPNVQIRPDCQPR